METGADQERTGGWAVWVRRCGRGCLKEGNNGKLKGHGQMTEGGMQDELSKGKQLFVGWC